VTDAVNNKMKEEDMQGIDAVSPLYAEVRAHYGAAFDAALARNVADALAEDVGSGDLTARLVPGDALRDARIVVRDDAVLCGVPWFVEVMRQVDPSIVVDWRYREGDKMTADSVVCVMRGPARALLTAERNVLNFLQMLSGVATVTRRFVDTIAGTRAHIVDTRKTLPGLRLAQKYAVRVGGGVNHRHLDQGKPHCRGRRCGSCARGCIRAERGRRGADRSGDARTTGIGARTSRAVDPARQFLVRHNA
jgi:nicotinate-nucleotide pyrophosphorylase (carboxylating)